MRYDETITRLLESQKGYIVLVFMKYLVKMMHPLSHDIARLHIRQIVSLTLLLMATIFIINNPSKLYASPSGIDFYSPSSPPPGVTSLEPLIEKWWNWWNAVPANTATN